MGTGVRKCRNGKSRSPDPLGYGNSVSHFRKAPGLQARGPQGLSLLVRDKLCRVPWYVADSVNT